MHSPKTEHHDGKEWRVVPLFPELLPFLRAVEATARPGFDVPFSAPVITRYRGENANLRTELDRAIRRAGLNPWPKRFQNLRSTRETELVDQGFPLHVVCAWLGNSPKVAQKHYLQVTAEHFDLATRASGAAPLPVHQTPFNSFPDVSSGSPAAENPENCDIPREFGGQQLPRQDSNLE